LDDHSAEAHNSLARLLYTFNQDWDGANREFNRAIQLNHNYAPAHHWYSMYLALENRKQEAVSEAQKAYQLDPLSPVVGANLAKILEEAGQTDKAIQQAKATLDIEPGSAVTHAVLGVIYQEQKRYGDAITEFKTALQLGAPEPETRGLLGYAYAASGHKEEAENLISDLKSLLPAQPHAALDIAAVYSGLEDKEDSLLWLEKAHQAKVSDLIGVAHDSRFASLQTDAGFQKIAQSVGPLH
jgi:serine/threonine-protein kinase